MALATTTLASDIALSQTVIKLTAFTNPSSGGISAKTVVSVDDEKMLVTSVVSSPTIQVTRGHDGTLASSHKALAPVYYGLTSDFTQPTAESNQEVYSYSVSGAITPPTDNCTVYLTKAGVGAMTLAAPGADQQNVVCIQSLTAQAHTVTNTTPGFNNGGTASDVATFGGAIGDNFVIQAQSGVWNVVTKTNVTLA